MSVENKIREMMSHKLEEADSSNMLKPGAGAKEAAPAKQGSHCRLSFLGLQKFGDAQHFVHRIVT